MSTQPKLAGTWAAGIAYVIWGLFPLYWVPLSTVPTFQLLAHRVLWCAVVVWLYLFIKGDLAWCRTLPPRTLQVLGAAALLLSINWGVYVLAMTTGHVVDASLGYFLTPLMNIALGVAILKERLNLWQGVAVALAASGVAYMTFSQANLPWIALVLAVTFGIYGLTRKLAPYPAVPTLAVESTLLLIPAAAYLIWCEARGVGAFLHGGLQQDLMLIFGGPVTAIPLVLFAYGVQRVPMTVVGVLQYISPTVGLMIGVLILGEPFGHAKFLAFALIWVAIAVFTVDGFRRYLRSRSSVVTPEVS
jgi:chloramphenicol-sensitive protein RarD